MPSFDIFTINTFNSRHASYRTCKLLGRSLHKFKSGENDIHLKCVTKFEVLIPPPWEKAGTVPNVRTKPAAKMVSNGFDMCLRKMESDYIVFCHSDAVMLHKDWDNILINLLERYKMVGVPYFNGNWNTYPSPVFCCAKRETWQRLNLSFTAEVENSSIVCKRLDEKWSKIFKMPIGTRVKFDVGWQIPFRLSELRYNYYVFPVTTSEEFFPTGERHKKPHTEWLYDNNLFLAHFQGVRTNNGSSSRKWMNNVEAFLNKK
jgi:hypothetical protein